MRFALSFSRSFRLRAIAVAAGALAVLSGPTGARAGGDLVITGFRTDYPFITLAATHKKCNLVSETSAKWIRCKDAQQAIPTAGLAVMEEKGSKYRFQIAGNAYWVNKAHVKTNQGTAPQPLPCFDVAGGVTNPSSTSGAGKDCTR